MPNEGFELIGHDAPLGRPGPVVPVGRNGDRLVVIYAGNEGAIVVEVDDDVEFERFDAGAMAKLRGFDYNRQRLFATDEKRVEAYAVEGEREFFLSLLNNSNFSGENPFLRLTLAEATSELVAITREVTSCVRYLEETAADLVESWYIEQRQSLQKSFGPRVKRILPAKWKELLGRQLPSNAKGRGDFFIPDPIELRIPRAVELLYTSSSQGISIMPPGINDGSFDYRIRAGGIEHHAYLTYELPGNADERSILMFTSSPALIRENPREYDGLVDLMRQTAGRFSRVKNVVNRLAEHEFPNLPNVRIAVHRFGPVPVYLLPGRYEVAHGGEILKVRIGVYPSIRSPARKQKEQPLPFLNTKTEFVRSLALGLGTIFTRYLEDVGEAMFDIEHYSGLANVFSRARGIEVTLAESIKTKLQVAVPLPESYRHPQTEHEQTVKELFEREHNWLFIASYAKQFALYYLNELYRLIGLESRSSEYLEGFGRIQEQFDALLGFGYAKSAREHLSGITTLSRAMRAYIDYDNDKLWEMELEVETKWVRRFVQFLRFVAALNVENRNPTAGRILISSSHRDVPVTRILRTQIIDYLEQHYGDRMEVLNILNGARGVRFTDRITTSIWLSDTVVEMIPKDVGNVSDGEDQPDLWMAREAAYGMVLGKRIFYLLEQGVDKDRIGAAMKRGFEPGGLVRFPARVPQSLPERLIEDFNWSVMPTFAETVWRYDPSTVDPDLQQFVRSAADYALIKRHRDILTGLYSMFPEHARETLVDIQEVVPYPKSATKAALARRLHARHRARYRTEKAAAKAIVGAWRLSSARSLLIDGKRMTLMTLHREKRYSGNLQPILKRLRPDFMKDEIQRWEKMVLNVVGSKESLRQK